jgi:hypothetical protein
MVHDLIYLDAISHVILCNIWVFWITFGHMFWNPRAALPGLSLWAVPLLIFVPGQSLAAQRTSDCVMITVTTYSGYAVVTQGLCHDTM